MGSKEVKLNNAEDLNFPNIQESTHSSPQKQKDSTTKSPRKESQAERTKNSALLDAPSNPPQGDQPVQYWLDLVALAHQKKPPGCLYLQIFSH